ncbi:MAG: cation:proton antiporter, partial [Deltaproteobacteria bacterium]|nr:cation:proton antiporter [Deltaproteobacteria bacterium]
RAEVDSPHGRTTLGILIFQDIIVVPMILITPVLAWATAGSAEAAFIFAGKGIGIILLVFVSAKWIVPQVLYQIARTRNRELFLLSIVLICITVTWLTSELGLSLALGAFLAGLIISESEYSHHALENILPFRDVFTSFFFVSVGMLLDVGFFFQQPLLIMLIAFGVLILKASIAGFVTILLGFPFRTAILAGFALCQVGEFSFILSRSGTEYGLITGDIYQMFLTVSILTMSATPFMIIMAPRLADIILRVPWPQRLKSGLHPGLKIEVSQKKDHIIIVGFGVNGKNVARAADRAGIPYVIIEMNPETVRSEQARGVPIYFGDATHEAILGHVSIKSARVVVIAINDPTATRRITEVARGLNSAVHVIVRTRYLQEMKALYELGADEVIPEEFETSVEIFSRVLDRYLVPRDAIERLVTEVRSDGYQMFRSLAKGSASFSDLTPYLPDVEICTLQLDQGSTLVGKTLAQTELRKKYGVTVLAIRRDSQILSNPDPNIQFEANDTLYIIGSPDKINHLAGLMRDQEKGARSS